MKNNTTTHEVDGKENDALDMNESSEPKLPFNHGEEVAIYKTVEKKIKLVKAAYLGPKDAGDANDMFSMVQLRTKYLNKDDSEVSLPEANANGKTTLNELDVSTNVI